MSLLMKYGILVSLALVLLVNCAKKNTEIRPLLAYVPEKASLIIKITNHDAFISTLKNNDFISEFNSTSTYHNILKKISHLDYVKPSSESLLAFTNVGGANFEFIYVTKNDANLFLLDSLQNKTLETIEFANSLFEKYTIANDVFYSLESGDKIIISSSKLLLEQLDGLIKPVQSEILQKLYSTTNSTKPASLLINLDEINSLLRSHLNEKSEVDVSEIVMS